MSTEKKFSAQEAAVAVLAKAEQLLKASALMKDQKGVHADISVNKQHGISEAGLKTRNVYSKQGQSEAKEEHKAKLSELKAMPKPNLTKNAEPKGEIHPKEHIQGEAAKPAERIEDQKAPEANPKEQHEGNNPEWGNEPGNYKLAKFCGHISAKRKMRG